MEEIRVTVKTAKLAQEKGFLQKPFPCFGSEGNLHTVEYFDTSHPNAFRYYQPTQSLLQKWLREVHGKHIQIYVMEKWLDSGNEMTIYFEVNLKTTNSLSGINNVKSNMLEFKTYEEALEVGLFEGLKLIKI